MKVSELQVNNKLYPLQNNPVQAQKLNAGLQKNDEIRSFSQILGDKLAQNQDIKFSAHAIHRLEEQQVEMSEQAVNRLNDGVRQLDAKGSKNSVILMNETAFVVSVKNRTVVTAVDKTLDSNSVFTNIDSVAIV